MKHVLVTGCSGFIGQHVVRALIAKGCTVRGIDRNHPPQSEDTTPQIEFIQDDLTEMVSLQQVTDGIDTIIHLAAIPREDRSRTWEDFIAVNVAATTRLVEAAEASEVCRFVFISTVEAAGFGDGTHPRTEENTPKPGNFYGKSKLAAEKVVFGQKGAVEKVVVRLPMIYGPGTDLIDAKLFGMVKKRFYPLIGNGSAMMEFCFVENAVNGILLAATHPAAAGELFYLSDERSYSIREVITAVAEGVGVPITFLHIPIPAAYCIALLWECAARLIPVKPFIMPASKKPFFSRETVWWTTHNVNMVSTAKIRSKLGYIAAVSINEGCRKTAAWFARRNQPTA